jgi:chemotaxis protein CheX
MSLNGVRQSVRQDGLGPSTGEGERRMTMTLRDSMHVVSDPENVDASVYEVFGTMLGVECRRAQSEDSVTGISSTESVTAVVGFGGILSGACVVSCDACAAQQIAGLMTGMEFASVDEVVKDGIGEICNMLAGAWKSKVPELSANCGLSVPAVITGRDYDLHVQSPEFKLRHVYQFGDVLFKVMIVCDGLL